MYMNQQTETADAILVKGARVNNLKNIDVRLPRDKFVVITGVSGSGSAATWRACRLTPGSSSAE